MNGNQPDSGPGLLLGWGGKSGQWINLETTYWGTAKRELLFAMVTTVLGFKITQMFSCSFSSLTKAEFRLKSYNPVEEIKWWSDFCKREHQHAKNRKWHLVWPAPSEFYNCGLNSCNVNHLIPHCTIQEKRDGLTKIPIIENKGKNNTKYILTVRSSTYVKKCPVHKLQQQKKIRERHKFPYSLTTFIS